MPAPTTHPGRDDRQPEEGRGAAVPANRAERRAAKKGKKAAQPVLPGSGEAAAAHTRARQGRRMNPIRRTGGS